MMTIWDCIREQFLVLVLLLMLFFIALYSFTSVRVLGIAHLFFTIYYYCVCCFNTRGEPIISVATKRGDFRLRSELGGGGDPR
jgi:hypothetical protein